MAHTFTVCKSCKSLNKVNSEKALSSEAICGKCSKPLNFHGLVSEVSGAELMRIVKKSDVPVIVDFWASWCGPCKVYGPTFEAASKQNKNAVFLKVNTEADPAISSQLGIRGIPTTVVFKNGQEVGRQSGALPQELISSLIG